MCILSVYILLKVVGYYDLSVLSMSVMGFKKIGWWVGGVSSIQFCFGFLEFFVIFAKPLSQARSQHPVLCVGSFCS